MGLIDNLRTRFAGPSRAVVYPGPMTGIDNFWPYVNLAGGGMFPLGLDMTMPGGKSEEIGHDFAGLVSGAYKSNGVVFACMLARLMIFSEARFQFQQVRKGRPGKLYGNASLDILERPWPGATTGDLLTQMLADADFAGNAFHTIRNGRIARMRPDWTEILVGSPTDRSVDSWDLEAEIVGYVYYPGGKYSGRDHVVLLPEQVSHFKPIPDPLSRFRGMSWLTPIVREIMADGAATTHKLKFFENGATPNLVITRPETLNRDVFLEWVKLMEEGHAGLANAYKSLYLMGGADATVVGKDMQQLEFKVTQGAGETRIAAAAGVHPVIVGLSEGMQGSSLNAGNFNSARRLVADRTMHPLWRNASGSLANIVRPTYPDRLWYDTRDIPFLREDRKDAADIQQIKGSTIAQLTREGFLADSVVAAVEAEDMTLLVHSNLFSVQLQKPGAIDTAPSGPVDVTPAPASPNGKKPAATGAKP